jgi:hypothetical protein
MTGHWQYDRTLSLWWQDIVSIMTGYCQYDDRKFSVWWQDIAIKMTGHCQCYDRTLSVWWQDIVSMVTGYYQYDERTLAVWWQDIVSMVTGHCQFTMVAFRSQTTNAPIQFPPVSSARRHSLTAGTDIQSASCYRNTACRWRWARCGLTSGLNTQFFLVRSRSLEREFVSQKQVK